jgi:hypothetical protein
MATVFLSHTSKDKPFARRIASSLTAKGIAVWIDEAEMFPGDSLIGKIEQGITTVDYLAVILSTNSVTSEWVLREVRTALHREISGKKVIVVPLLLEDCQVPPFLRDKIYADFRNKRGYDAAVAKVIERFQRDDEQATKEALEWVDAAPFTKLWRLALETRQFSERFSKTLRTILVEMSSEEKNQWSPQIAASYLLFLAEIKKGGIGDRRLWSVLRELIETREIRAWLRYQTLAVTLPSFSASIERGDALLPRLFEEGVADPLVEHIVKSYLDAADEAAAGSSIRVLTRLWELGDRSYRERLMMALEARIRSRDHKVDVLRPLKNALKVRTADKPETSELFTQLRAAWLRQSEAAGGPDPTRLATEIVEALSSSAAAPDAKDRLLSLYREAARQEEVGDFALYAHLIENLDSEHLKRIRKRQGDAFTLGILADIVVDPDVEVMMSTLALGFILHEGFGTESLLLNDALLPSLLETKYRGQHKMSVVDALCHSVDDGGDMWGASLLVQIYSLLDEHEQAAFMRTLGSHSTKRAAALRSYLEGKLDLKGLERSLK